MQIIGLISSKNDGWRGGKEEWRGERSWAWSHGGGGATPPHQTV